MIRWPEDEAGLRRIIERGDFTVPDYNRRSFRGPEGYQTGMLGELVVMDWLDHQGVSYNKVFSTAHDLSVEGRTWEIKTKERTVVPQPHYDCTIPAYNHEHQQPYIYCFVSLCSTGKSSDMYRFYDSHILGTIQRSELERRARYLTPESPPDRNGWVPTIPCYNLTISELDHPEKLHR